MKAGDRVQVNARGHGQGAEQPNGDDLPKPPPDSVFAPALDIHETPEGLVLEADLPGVGLDQLEVRVKDNVLHIYGKVSWPVPPDAKLLYEELRPGDFYRSFILSDEVDTERIEADFNQGVLRLTLPRAAKVRPRKIEVRSAQSGSGSPPVPRGP
jgi:HSP20 family molecular chaperone IbpA